MELVAEFPHQVRRWTVLLRLILAIPFWIVLAVFSIGIGFVTIAAWFAALALGRLPRGLFDVMVGYIGCWTRLSGYVMLLTDHYPPLSNSAPYPVRIELPAQGQLNRAAVLFRILLIIPAAIVSSLAMAGWWSLFALITWVAELAVGRVPVLLFTANAAVLRYTARVLAYGGMVTSTYPKRLFGDGRVEPDSPVPPTTRPLLLSLGAQVVIGVCLVLGLLSYVQNSREAASQAERGHLGGTVDGLSR